MLQGKDTIFHKIPTFKLIDKDGTPFTDKNLTEKIYVANFFSTNCTTICPKMTHQLERVQAKFIKNKDVNIVSYSIDTKNDSPQVLKAFAIKNEAIANKWHFVTGDKTALFNLALNGYKLAIADAANYDKKISEDKADIHSEKLLLIDKSGYIRGIYNGTRADDVDRLIVEMQILLDIYQKKDE